MSFNVQQSNFGIAYKPQTALQTANTAADFWKLSKLNAAFNKFGMTTETDATEVGKGSEFAENIFPVSYDIAGSLEKILSSEMAAWAFLFGLGTANATYADGAYTVTEMDACDGLDMPAFSVVEQGGVGCSGGAYFDRVAIGCVINDFGIKFTNGPGRNSAMLTANFIGCGKNTIPSGIVMPTTKLAEHEIRGGSATVSINGVDYVASKDLLSLDMSFNNNIRADQGFFVGSGTQDGAAIRGRMERGNRAYGLSFTARLEQASTEYAKLKALTTGPATITLTNSITENVAITYQKVAFSSVDLAEDNGIATVAVQCTPMRHATLGVISVVAKTAIVELAGVA
jgi:hypothetical protein